MYIGDVGLNEMLILGCNFIILAAIHLLIIYIYSTVDPCNNNQGWLARLRYI